MTKTLLTSVVTASAALLMSASISADAGFPADFNGKSGASLRAAIALYATPDRYVDPVGNCVDITGTASRSEFFDPFSNTHIPFDSSITYPGVIPVSYWELSGLFQKASADLFNHIPFTAESAANRGDAIPGTVESVGFDNGVWRSGRGHIAGFAVDFYEPPARYRGDFARIIFYMAALYPTDSWTARGYMIMDGTDYPALNDYARELLLDYHRSDPVSDEERQRNRTIRAIQGNSNPFVEYPELAEYLWGDNADQEIIIPDEPLPLRAVYTMSDKEFRLTSPYIPTDARWSVNGKPVTTPTIAISTLGTGDHLLEFYSPSTRASGMLTIRINP